MYVAAANGVTPVSTATNTPGTPIKLGTQPGSIAITPDGKTAYIANLSPATVIPVSTATNTPGQADQARRRPHRGDRDHAGREDRLCPERPP